MVLWAIEFFRAIQGIKAEFKCEKPHESLADMLLEAMEELEMLQE